MTSLLSARFLARQSLQCRRYIHRSPSALAKSKAASVDVDDELFGENADDGDLFGDATLSAQESKTKVLPQKPKKAAPTPRKGMDDSRRTEEYTNLYDFVAPRLREKGNPDFTHPPYVKIASLNRLMDLATTTEHLSSIVDLIPFWVKYNGRGMKNSTADVFVRRCHDFKCPQLALKVFGNFPLYQAKLTRPAAQQLLYTLHRTSAPLENLILTAAFFPIYRLGPLENDIVSLSILAAASVKADKRDLETALLRRIYKSLGVKDSSSGVRVEGTDLRAKWVMWHLREIDLVLEKRNGRPLKWLRDWRHRSQRTEPAGSKADTN
ncbi:uncharacterized protein BT62DRAFT_929497 [Guyanagaster necrorhizus]|uniref:Uncharacterized protein n=1 Tax=Guyanagaster necrorhizus TaxID=856835 RepID=A0A9P7VWT3_9AGAR|nr:uncharacterized protein BT62DRAFT_929497 [Guyanagaster necrorhizus MCA 3950]KAG7448404.1 hypothetical protein BT62DRAFT_929497 [Guyanagaster necrorhizus MCA 3950]